MQCTTVSIMRARGQRSFMSGLSVHLEALKRLGLIDANYYNALSEHNLFCIDKLIVSVIGNWNILDLL